MKKLIVFSWLMFAVVTADAQRVYLDEYDQFALTEVPEAEICNLRHFESSLSSVIVYEELRSEFSLADISQNSYSRLYGKFDGEKFIPYSCRKGRKLAWKKVSQCVKKTDNPVVKAYMRVRLLESKAKLSKKNANSLNATGICCRGFCDASARSCGTVVSAASFFFD